MAAERIAAVSSGQSTGIFCLARGSCSVHMANWSCERHEEREDLLGSVVLYRCFNGSGLWYTSSLVYGFRDRLSVGLQEHGMESALVVDGYTDITW